MPKLYKKILTVLVFAFFTLIVSPSLVFATLVPATPEPATFAIGDPWGYPTEVEQMAVSNNILYLVGPIGSVGHFTGMGAVIDSAGKVVENFPKIVDLSWPENFFYRNRDF